MPLKDYNNLSRCKPANWLRKSPARYRSLASLSPRGWAEWGWAFLRYAIGPRVALPTAAGQILMMPVKTTMALCADWAADTAESLDVANLIRADAPDYTINLGDIYYVGDPKEVEQNVFGVAEDDTTPQRWPSGKRGTFWIPGNHEMLARGFGYYRVVLPYLGQKASWFALQNPYWTVIGLDTGYNSASLFHRDASLPRQCLDWLAQNRLRLFGMRNASPRESQYGQRGIILLTHHQPISSFDQAEYPAAARQLAQFIGRPVLWFWGHEHRAATYGPWKVDPAGFTFYGHCMGHGGMPVKIHDGIERPERPLKWCDERTHQVDGMTVGYNGYVSLAFEGQVLSVKYVDIDSIVRRSEIWAQNGGVPVLVHES